MNVTCGRCGERRLHCARRLCLRCYELARRDGTLPDHERIRRPLVDTISDYQLLAAEGYPKRVIAARLRISYGALDQALMRARRAGLLERAR